MTEANAQVLGERASAFLSGHTQRPPGKCRLCPGEDGAGDADRVCAGINSTNRN